MIEKLRENNLEIFEKLPVTTYVRPEEIAEYVKDHPEIESYVSLDDDWLEMDYRKYGIENCLVATSFYGIDGGLQENKKEVIFWLNPMDQHNNNWGWFTVEDLKKWAKGKGKIPKN